MISTETGGPVNGEFAWRIRLAGALAAVRAVHHLGRMSLPALWLYNHR